LGGPTEESGSMVSHCSASWSPDGTMLASGALGPMRDQMMVIWDAVTWKQRLTIPTKGPSSPAWAPKGARLAWCDARTVRIWDVSTGKESQILEIKDHEGWVAVTRVSWSRDGKRLASGDTSGMVRIWDGATGNQVLAIQATEKNDQVRSLSWNADGS